MPSAVSSHARALDQVLCIGGPQVTPWAPTMGFGWFPTGVYVTSRDRPKTLRAT
jgi:hypothetical protein